MSYLDFGQPWVWVIGGTILAILEVALPGVFLLWFGLAAIATGLVMFALPMTWPWATLLFCVLAVVFGLLGRRLMRNPEKETDQPFLNRRGAAFIGQVFTLAEPIANGNGRLRIADSVWRITGPDMVAGAKIRVVGVEGATLKVEAANLS